ncbi:hypothetical protein CE91St51_36700 [[Clostridium] innocuum]|nr:hypothetical protein CE91St51_36700 [[Clostridium] innocuum]
MDPVAMNTTVYFIWKVAYCCHMDSNCIGITNGLSYIGLHYRLYKKGAVTTKKSHNAKEMY